MSVTAVPIQPIKKGSVAKYWLGVSAVVLAGAGLAWWGTSAIRTDHATEAQFLAENAGNAGVMSTQRGVQIQTLHGGEGKSPTADDIVLVKYKGMLRDGTVFDENPQAPMEVSGVVPGFSEALQKMQRGGKYKVWIPGKLGYGPNPPQNPQTGQPALPPDATLIFEVELLDFRTRAEVEAMQKQAEEMRKKQGGAQGGGGGLPPDMQRQLEAQLQGQ